MSGNKKNTCIMCREEGPDKELLKCSVCIKGAAHEGCVKVHLAFSAPPGLFSTRSWKCVDCATDKASLSFKYSHVLQARAINLSIHSANDNLATRIEKSIEDTGQSESLSRANK
jgi:hypothetical protein